MFEYYNWIQSILHLQKGGGNFIIAMDNAAAVRET